MRKKPNVKLIGIFVIAGILLFVGIMAIFFKDRTGLKKDHLLVMYFPGSIKGLSVGSPLYINGVQIGKVVDIDMFADIDDIEFRSPVFVEVNPKKDLTISMEIQRDRTELWEYLVNNGLRARLITQSFITGQLGIEFVIRPHSFVYYRGTYTANKGVIEIPTLPSMISQLEETLQNIRIKETFNELNLLLKNINNYAPSILSEIEGITKAVNHDLEIINIEENNPLDNLNQTLKDISNMAKSFKNFADYIERNPEALLRGKDKY